MTNVIFVMTNSISTISSVMRFDENCLLEEIQNAPERTP